MCRVLCIVDDVGFKNWSGIRFGIKPLKIYIKSVIATPNSVSKFAAKLTLRMSLGYWSSATMRISSWVETKGFAIIVGRVSIGLSFIVEMI